MTEKIFYEVYFNVWNCQAPLRVELWQDSSHSQTLLNSRDIPCSEAELEKNVKYINFSGRYPATELNENTAKKVETALQEMYSEL